MRSWAERHADMSRLIGRQLFFVGGAPRSGTTWLQSILDAHPEICCKGEGLFQKELAVPLERMMTDRGRALEVKNQRVFRHSGGYPLPSAGDTEFLLGTAILLALDQQAGGKPCRAIGEKTPENVFFFPRLKRLFPNAKLICIARDPRDVLTSAWHFFHTARTGDDPEQAKWAFVRGALPSLAEGGRAMLSMSAQYPADCLIITYETLRRSTGLTAARLFGFLGVSTRDDIVDDCLARTSFSAMSGDRPDGEARDGSFFRKGAVGDWASTLTAEMNGVVLRELGWMFPRFGWEP